MPRRLLRDGLIVEDDWFYRAEAPADPAGALILTWAEWLGERDAWIGRGGRLGVALLPADRVEQLAADPPPIFLDCLQLPRAERRTRLLPGPAAARTLEIQRRAARHGPRAPRSTIFHGALRIQQF